MSNDKIQKDDNLISPTAMSRLQKAIAEQNARVTETPNVIDASTIPSQDLMSRMLQMESEARAEAGLDPEIPVAPPAPEEEVSEEDVLEHRTATVVQGMPILEEDDDEPTPTGGGLIINKDEYTDTAVDREPIKGGGRELIEDKAMEHIKEYMSEMDEDLEKVKQAHETIKTEVLTDEEIKEGLTENQVNRLSDEDYDKLCQEAVVIIDKSGVCTIDFTDEEREKLRVAKKIKLEEVETKELKTIKTRRKSKKMSVETLLKSVSKNSTTTVPLMSSGFTVTLRGCSVLELIDLIDNKEGKDDITIYKDRWSFIHDKIVATSLGDMTYSEFIKKVSYNDRPMLIYGLTCASFPDEDTVLLHCGHCGKTYEHKYSISSLLRLETMSEKLRERVKGTVDNSFRLDTSKAYAENSPVNSVKRVVLPITGIIIDFENKSIEGFLHKNIEEWQNDKLPQELALAALMTTYIGRMLVPTGEGDYYDIDDYKELCEIIYRLPNADSAIISRVSNAMAEDSMVTFGFTKMVCPHCETTTNMIETDIDGILFQQCEREMNTTVE